MAVEERPGMKVILFLAALALMSSTTPAFADGGGVTGYVLDSRTHEGIAGAQVVVTGPLGIFQTATHRDGFYAFLGLLPGPYRLESSKDGYGPSLCLISSTSLVLHDDQVQSATVWLHRGPIIISSLPPCVTHPARPVRPSLVDPNDTADVYDIN